MTFQIILIFSIWKCLKSKIENDFQCLNETKKTNPHFDRQSESRIQIVLPSINNIPFLDRTLFWKIYCNAMLKIFHNYWSYTVRINLFSLKLLFGNFGMYKYFQELLEQKLKGSKISQDYFSSYQKYIKKLTFLHALKSWILDNILMMITSEKNY